MPTKRQFLLSTSALMTAAALSTAAFREASASPTIQGAALISPHSPTLGPAGAKVHIVEFIDPACEGCKGFYPIVKAVMAEYPGKIRLTVRHVAFHRGADYPVKVLEAARKQGKYWEVLDALFAKQSNWAVNHKADPRLVMESVKGVGLDLPRLELDMNAPDVAKFMQQDMADAKILKVAQTPDFYVNGKHLNPFGVNEFRALVGSEVKAAYP